jgi:hypothetical protein
LDAVLPHKLALDGGPLLMRDAAASLASAVVGEPRDLTTIRERVAELAASALRVIRAISESDEAPTGFANPTPDRLPAMIDEDAPNRPARGSSNRWPRSSSSSPQNHPTGSGSMEPTRTSDAGIAGFLTQRCVSVETCG